MSERLSLTLQESLLALLCFDKKHGAEIAAQVRLQDFDGIHREIASAVIQYRNRHKKPPGKKHIQILVDRLPIKDQQRRSAEDYVARLKAAVKGLNGAYLVTQAQTHVRHQALKTGVIEAARILSAANKQEAELEQAEEILYKALKFRSQNMDGGARLSDVNAALRFLNKTEDITHLGIEPFDKRGIGIEPKTLSLYIAPKNSGKSWFCNHVGRQGLMQRKNVLHIGLEMGQDEIMKRYLQSMFAIGQKNEDYVKSIFKLNEYKQVTGWRTKAVHPRNFITQPKIASSLSDKIHSWGTRFNNIIVKEFPTGSLTIQQLELYLDYLDQVENFQPHILIVDYPDLMHIDGKNYRIDLGRIFESLRGLAVSRNMAVIAPTQSSRSSYKSQIVRSDQVAEDIRKVNTADFVYTYSQTKQEYDANLARLCLEYSRTTERGVTVILSQAYQIGQYVLNAVMPAKGYWDRINERGAIGAEDDEPSDEGSNEPKGLA